MLKLTTFLFTIVTSLNCLAIPLVNDDGNIGLIERELNNGNQNTKNEITDPLARRIYEQNLALLDQLEKDRLQNTREDFSNSPNLFPSNKYINVTGYLKAQGFGSMSGQQQINLLKETHKTINKVYPNNVTLSKIALISMKIPGSKIFVNNNGDIQTID
ncbi:hypothetical protein WFU86_003737 [Proteus mirabilis]|uniref:hypothetical protein n=1 Tax=Proteus mirabilis TaxID=584 RepID=UPI0009AE3082|nr:hypothetical protein [Proteus mirabilis]ARA24475.1 hypothetical protein AM438_19050 [Proteus mirabilis]